MCLRRSVVCWALVTIAAARAMRPRHGPTATTEAASTSLAAPVTLSPSGQFVGSWMQTRRGRSLQAYRGIPYAEPPTGEMRFQPPKLIEKYEEAVDASEEGPACPQPADTGYYVDEDCLRLNVYTTGNDTLKPVIVYFHSGGFYSVSGRSDVAGPHYLLDQDLVFVPVNYRLASLGFLSTGDELAPGNNGLKDQVAALKWVQRNIASFGGDPNLVTIAGCSAGSFSVMLHMISPMSKGLFHRAISVSGSPISQIPVRAEQRELAEKQARLLNCPSDSSRAIVDCLRNRTAKELGDSLDGFSEFAHDPVLVWLPLVEEDYGQERFLTMAPIDAIRAGRMHSVPHLISMTTDEFFWKANTILDNATLLHTLEAEWARVAPIAFQLPRGDARAASRLRQAYLPGALANDASTADGLGKLYSDGIIGFGVHRMANLMCRYSQHKVFYSQFDYMGNNSHHVSPDTGKPMGVAHHDDLIYLFSISAIFPTIEVSDSEDSKMVDRMTGLWYNFARYGDPAPRDVPSPLRGLPWPPMAPARRTYLRINQQPSLHQNLFEDRYNIWEELYDTDLY